MSALDPTRAEEEVATCATCGSDCDFGQRGDGPAEEDTRTGRTYCGVECFGLALVQARQREEA